MGEHGRGLGQPVEEVDAMPKSTGRPPVDKPGKPYPDFPLYAHANPEVGEEDQGKTLLFRPLERRCLDRSADPVRTDLQEPESPCVGPSEA